MLTANSRSQGLEPTTDTFSLPAPDTPFLNRDVDSGIKDSVPTSPPANIPTTYNETLAELEKQIGSPHANMTSSDQMASTSGESLSGPNPSSSNLNQARGAVETAIDQNPESNFGPLPPIEALNALPVYDKHDEVNATPVTSQEPKTSMASLGIDSILQPPTDQFPGESMNMPMPAAGYSSSLVSPTQPNPISQNNGQSNPMTPPPVPPPMIPFPTSPLTRQ